MIKKKIQKIKIGRRTIACNEPVFIIAEAGVNHNGRLDLALKLVDAAKAAGADAVKFQTFRAEQVVTESGEMAEYQKKNTGKTESQIAMLRALELKEEFYAPIIKHCEKEGIIFLSTPHGGFEGVDFLASLGVPAFKFGSGDLTNLPVLAYAAKFRKPMILGTGMATMNEVKEAIACIKKAGNDKIVVLHCTTNYPCLFEEVNLRAMKAMMNELDVLVGYSDHTAGSVVPVMSVALGAVMIEKHLTLDNSMAGPDHKASSDPAKFKGVVGAVKIAKTALGSAKKKPTAGEIKLQKIARKSVVTTKSIVRGEIFNADNIAIKRPGTGLEPKEYYGIIGKTAKKNLKGDTLIKRNDYE